MAWGHAGGNDVTEVTHWWVGVRDSLHGVLLVLSLTTLDAIKHILASCLPDALHLAGYSGNLPRPHS